MIRKQFYVDEDLDYALKVLARRTKRSEADHVRTALRAYVEEQLRHDADNDPLLAMAGIADDPDAPADGAAEHDHYLYGWPKRGS